MKVFELEKCKENENAPKVPQVAQQIQPTGCRGQDVVI
jgi:hypothetical protein